MGMRGSRRHRRWRQPAAGHVCQELVTVSRLAEPQLCCSTKLTSVSMPRPACHETRLVKKTQHLMSL